MYLCLDMSAASRYRQAMIASYPQLYCCRIGYNGAVCGYYY
jgi:hypothetical protein